MFFYKAVIFIIILKIILHTGTGNDNLECIEGESNIATNLLMGYMAHYILLSEYSQGMSPERIMARTRRVLTAVMEGVIRDESEGENPNELCLKAMQHCSIYEGTAQHVTVTAEGLQKIGDMDADVSLTRNLYPTGIAKVFKKMLKFIPALKCKVQIVPQNYVPQNNIPQNNVSLEYEYDTINDLFDNMTLNGDYYPNGTATNHVATNGVTANGSVHNDADTNSAIIDSRPPGFTYYGIFFSNLDDSNSSDVSDSATSNSNYPDADRSDADRSYADSSDADRSDADPSNANPADADSSDSASCDADFTDAASSDTFYFFIFIYRAHTKYPMFIFVNNRPNKYSPAFQIIDLSEQTDGVLNDPNEQPNDVNNNSNGHRS